MLAKPGSAREFNHTFCPTFTNHLQFFTNLYLTLSEPRGLIARERTKTLHSPLEGKASVFNRRHQMSANDRSFRTRSATTFLFLANTRIRQGIALTSTLLLAISCLAQRVSLPTSQLDSKTISQDALSSAKPAPEATTITVPAGTRIALVLTHPIQSRVYPPRR